MKISSHPVWLVGFRPFFILAAISGIIYPLIWILIFAGNVSTLNHSLTPNQWHAHEMFFGFGLALLGGFLLTATKNWVNIRGYHGSALIFLALAWLTERIAISFGESWSPLLFFIANNIFLIALMLMIQWTLINYRKQDGAKDNIIFVIALPLFIIAKNLMLSSEYFSLGMTMTIGLFRMAFLVMLERTLTQFMKSATPLPLPRIAWIDNSIKSLGFFLIFEPLFPSAFTIPMFAAIILLLAYRFLIWKPQLALKRIDIGIMYLGYIAITFQLFLELLNKLGYLHSTGALSVHVFTFCSMGLIIPAMMIRISKGHTGRSVHFDGIDRLTLWIMILGLILRTVFTQSNPEFYLTWIRGAAVCWSAGFLILLVRYLPYLVQTRADGREH